jgi:hypothetical protein
MEERVERHADDVRRPTSEAPGCSPECPTQRCGQTDGDLILHDWSSNSCTAIVVQCTAAGKAAPTVRIRSHGAPRRRVSPKLSSALCQNCVTYRQKPWASTVICPPRIGVLSFFDFRTPGWPAPAHLEAVRRGELRSSTGRRSTQNVSARSH